MEPFTYVQSTVWTKCVEFATDVITSHLFHLFLMLAGEGHRMGHFIKQSSIPVAVTW